MLVESTVQRGTMFFGGQIHCINQLSYQTWIRVVEEYDT
jgi:hypothetical protein